MTTFRGLFEHSLDAKHRLTVPSGYREVFQASGAVLAASSELEPDSPRSVSIWRPDDYAQFVDKTLSEMNPASPQARALERFFFNFSAEVELDSANRLMIPANLRQYAGLGKEVTVAGSGRYLEIYDRPSYASYQENLLSQIPGLTASLGGAG